MRAPFAVPPSARGGLFGNVLALSTVQVCRKAIPLLTLPYLARVLGPDGWGLLMFFQSFSACVIILVEFGFGLSAARDVARTRNCPGERSQIVTGVVGAQFVLASMALAATGLLGFWIPPLFAHPEFMVAAMLWVVAEGCSPYWYFLGMERMGAMAGLEISTKLLANAGVFFVVHAPEHGARVLLLQAAGSVLSWAAGQYLMRRQTPGVRIGLRLIRQALQSAWPMFIIRSAESLFSVGNAFLLGVLASPSVVGYFAGPEKLSRALFGLFDPVRDALYPRISSLSRSAPQEALRLARVGTAMTLAAGVLIGAGVFLAAPVLIRLVLGPAFLPAVPILRLLAVLPVLLSITQSVSLQWLLPQGRERVFTRIILIAGIVHVALVFLWAPRYAQTGMAWAVLASETLVCLASLAAALRLVAEQRRRTLFRLAGATAGSETARGACRE